MTPGRRYLPERSISRLAAGRKASLPTAAILPLRIATPPSMVPAGVTIKPSLKTMSAGLVAIFESARLFFYLLSCFRQVAHVDEAIYGRWQLLQAEVFPVLCDFARALQVDAAVSGYGFLGFHVQRIGFFRFLFFRFGALGERAHRSLLIFRVVEKLAGFKIGAQEPHREGFVFLRPVAAYAGDRVLKIVDVVGRESERAEPRRQRDEIRGLVDQRARYALILHRRQALRRAAEADHFIIFGGEPVRGQHPRQNII